MKDQQFRGQSQYKVFLCHNHRDARFVIEVAKHLKRSLGEVFYYEDRHDSDRPFPSVLGEKINECDVFITFVGKKFSKYQELEVASALRKVLTEQKDKRTAHLFLVHLPGVEKTPGSIEMLNNFECISISDLKPMEEEAYNLAKEIVRKLGCNWHSIDDLPLDPHLFSYEKYIIEYFIKKARLEDEITQAEMALDFLTKTTGEETSEAQNNQGGELEDQSSSARISEQKNQLEMKLEDLQSEYSELLEKQLDGCPDEWPEVVHWIGEGRENYIEEGEIGAWRPEEARVVAAALSTYHHIGNNDDSHGVCLIKRNLCFPEAGPRKRLYYPTGGELRVAVLISGGIAPGINAVIDGINQRHHMYAKSNDHEVLIFGLKNGFHAFDDFFNSSTRLTTTHHQFFALPTLVTTDSTGEGGSILGTSRDDELIQVTNRNRALERIVSQLFANNIDILYIIGGDGSMKAAHAIWSFAKHYTEEREPQRRLSVVAIPKTMDNDILWVWQTFGFLSAVEEARGVIENLATEVKSNPRLGIIQLFGSDSGFVVSHAVLASRTGICDAALIPEVEFSMLGLSQYLQDKIDKRMRDQHENIPYGMVVMAETAVPTDALNYIYEPKIGLNDAEKEAIHEFIKIRQNKRRIEGQTNDHLRNAGLKIVCGGLSSLLKWKNLRVFTNEPRHLVRAISPSCSDIIIGNRLGTLAVDNAMAGYTDFMISQWLTEYVLVPLRLVVLGRKRIPERGIFWKSVLAKTGQPVNLDVTGPPIL